VIGVCHPNPGHGRDGSVSCPECPPARRGCGRYGDAGGGLSSSPLQWRWIDLPLYLLSLKPPLVTPGFGNLSSPTPLHHREVQLYLPLPPVIVPEAKVHEPSCVNSGYPVPVRHRPWRSLSHGVWKVEMDWLLFFPLVLLRLAFSVPSPRHRPAFRTSITPVHRYLW